LGFTASGRIGAFQRASPQAMQKAETPRQSQ
jgi:hypothetical protein